MSILVYTCTREGLKSVTVAFSSLLYINSGNRDRSLSCGLSQIIEIVCPLAKHACFCKIFYDCILLS